MSRIQDELAQKNQRLLRERKERQQKLEQIRKHQILLKKKVWASFMACQFATEELKNRVGLNRAPNTNKPERPFQTLMQGQYTNALDRTSNYAAMENDSSISNEEVPPLLDCYSEDNLFSDFFKQQQTTGMDSTMMRWENLGSPIESF